jgi:hypothetical protein
MAGNDGTHTAREARLRYVSDAEPGITRRPNGSGFTFVDAKGRLIQDDATLSRIKALVIPPAWTDVWISPRSDGHLQATGRDITHGGTVFVMLRSSIASLLSHVPCQRCVVAWLPTCASRPCHASASSPSSCVCSRRR